jgi:hypothetical protein
MDDKTLCDARSISKLLLDKAKNWWGLSISFQMLVFAVGIVATSAGVGAEIAAFFVVVLSVASYLCRLRSSTWQGRGDCLRRKLDLQDAYGWEIPNSEWSDILATVGQRDRHRLKMVAQEPYFASGQPPGTSRAVQNLQESSWFSKHLACVAGHISLTVIVVLLGVSIAAIAIAMNSLKDFDLMANIARVVTSALMLVFSMDILSLTLRYYAFSSKAGMIERHANGQIMSGQDGMVLSLKLWQDYHVSRAMAPLIPTWLWQWKRGSLNQIWETYRK